MTIVGLPAQSYNEAHQQNAQPLHYLPAGTNILAFLRIFLVSRVYTIDTMQSFNVNYNFYKGEK